VSILKCYIIPTVFILFVQKSEKLKKKALQAVFNEFIHEIDRQQGWNDEVKLEKLTRKMSQEERSLKNQSGIQLWKLFKAGLVLSTLPKRRRRSKRDLSGIEGAGPVKLEHLFGNEWSKIHMHGLGFGEVKSPTGKGSLIKDKTKFMEIWNKANMLNQPNPKDEKAPWEVGHDEEKEGNMEDLWKGSRMSMPHIIGREAESDTDTDTDSSSFFSSKRSDASVGSSFSSLSSKSSSSLHLQNSNSLDSQFVGSSR
jgi:hypothetical protein